MKDYDLIFSKHSLIRAKERFGYNEYDANRFISRAFIKGKKSEEMPSRERKYMNCKEAATGCRTVFYNGAFFIFGLDDICITLYAAPEWFGRKILYQGKKQIRDTKKYQRYLMPDYQ